VAEEVGEQFLRLATGRNFATLTTLMPDGAPSSQVMWIDATPAHALVNTEIGRQKYRNVRRDPRVAITVWNDENPYEYSELRGVVEDVVTGPEALAHADRLSERYFGRPYDRSIIRTERVVLRIRPSRQGGLAGAATRWGADLHEGR
jgi:PPOX class probable F420-dependent enzyme